MARMRAGSATVLWSSLRIRSTRRSSPPFCQASRPFGGGGEAEQQLGAEVIEPAAVAGGGGVVVLIHDHHLEAIGGNLARERLANECNEANTWSHRLGISPST